MMKKRSARLNSKGFTLVELLVVIAILALLAGIGVPQVMRTLQRSREVADLSAIETVQSAVDAFRAETGAKWFEIGLDDAALGGTEPTENAIEIVVGDLTVALNSLIGDDEKSLGDLLEGATFPTLKSKTGYGWYIHSDGHVYVSATGADDLFTDATENYSLAADHAH